MHKPRSCYSCVGRNLITIIIIVLLSTIMLSCDPEEKSPFVDNNLEECVLKITDGSWKKEDLENVKKLHCGDMQIEDLEGIQLLVNLEELMLHNNNISNVTPLKDLKKIKRMSLLNNSVQNITSMQSLISLEGLVLAGNQIESIETLKDMSNLTELNISDNQIKTLKPLEGLPLLKTISFENNYIIYLEPLKTMPSLLRVYPGGNCIYLFPAGIDWEGSFDQRPLQWCLDKYGNHPDLEDYWKQRNEWEESQEDNDEEMTDGA